MIHYLNKNKFQESQINFFYFDTYFQNFRNFMQTYFVKIEEILFLHFPCITKLYSTKKLKVTFMLTVTGNFSAFTADPLTRMNAELSKHEAVY